jgi:hypothetical protein
MAGTFPELRSKALLSVVISRSAGGRRSNHLSAATAVVMSLTRCPCEINLRTSSPQPTATPRRAAKSWFTRPTGSVRRTFLNIDLSELHACFRRTFRSLRLRRTPCACSWRRCYRLSAGVHGVFRRVVFGLQAVSPRAAREGVWFGDPDFFCSARSVPVDRFFRRLKYCSVQGGSVLLKSQQSKWP